MLRQDAAQSFVAYATGAHAPLAHAIPLAERASVLVLTLVQALVSPGLPWCHHSIAVGELLWQRQQELAPTALYS